MVRRVFTVFCLGAIAILMTSCGQTYELQSISVSPSSANFDTFGSTQQFTVTATYTNTKTEDVTARSNYSIGPSPALNSTTAPLPPVNAPISYNDSGLVTASANVPACTYAPTTNVPSPYSLNITYTENGITKTASASLNVATASGCNVTTSS
jgi:hypothetical protein